MKTCGSTGAWNQGLSLSVGTLYHWATGSSCHLINNCSPEPYPVTHFPDHLKFVHEFPVGKSTNFLYPCTKDIQTKPPLHSGLFMLGAICNRWKSVARPGLEPRAFRRPCEHATTELPSHPMISSTTFYLNPTRLH